MNEAEAYTALRPRIRDLDPQRIESVVSSGVPDVWYRIGAIEMKYLEDWPKRSTTPVRVQTLMERPEQVAWLTRRWMNGGPAWLMLRVAYQYLLFAGPHARLIRFGLTRWEVQALAVWKTTERGIGNWEELHAWLLWDEKALPPDKADRLRRLRTADVSGFMKKPEPIVIDE